MPRVLSLHQYAFKQNVDPQAFVRAASRAKQKGLFDLPGLIDFSIMKGIRGQREGCYAALWIYASVSAWESLWGEMGQPISAQDYPESWKIWEQEYLAPLLHQDPDQIDFTAYLQILGP